MSDKIEIPEQFTTGLLLSGYSDKDYKLEEFLAPAGGATFPDEFVYETQFPILAQGNVSSCVAHSLRKLKEYMEKKERGYQREMSTDFIYWNRLPHQYQGVGMFTREALEQLTRDGVCYHSSLPSNTEYDPDYTRITRAMRDEAYYQKVKKFATVNKNIPNAVEQALIVNGPMIASLSTYSFFHAFLPQLVPSLPKDYIQYRPGFYNIGNHSVLVLGYRRTDKGLELKIQNSWGEVWGDHGTVWLSADYPVYELWTIVDEFLPPPEVAKKVEFTIDFPVYTANGKDFTMDTTPIIKEGRTFLPARFVAAALSCSIEFLPKQGLDGGDLVSIYDPHYGYVKVYVGTNKILTEDNKTITMDIESYIDEHGRTMVPLRPLAEAMHFDVEWIPSERQVIITRPY